MVAWSPISNITLWPRKEWSTQETEEDDMFSSHGETYPHFVGVRAFAQSVVTPLRHLILLAKGHHVMPKGLNAGEETT